MIGDSLTADIQGGNNAGIDSVWFNPSNIVNETPAVPTYQVKSYEKSWRFCPSKAMIAMIPKSFLALFC